MGTIAPYTRTAHSSPKRSVLAEPVRRDPARVLSKRTCCDAPMGADGFLGPHAGTCRAALSHEDQGAYPC